MGIGSIEQSLRGPVTESPLAPEPIAIIGIGCRFPGAPHPEAFWQLMASGVDAVGEIPLDRFDINALYDPRPGTPGRMMTRWGGFLPGVELFDASFFGIAPREAERLDPQQRLLLEVAWEALEDAGQVPDRLAGGETGVFIGMWINDYEARMFRDPDRIDFYMTTGTGRYTGAGRLSHVFDFRGPSVTIDTACSSSLVAVHLACQSLCTGECALALAGGVNVILEPSISIAYSQSRLMAPDGRCKFGDARADGYVRSEGAGLVVLKRLSSALSDRDPIYALILGSAVNNDGHSGGSLGTPGRQGQEELLRKAYRRAGISPSRVHYVEAHGTGTSAGDPVELQALGAIVGEGRAQDRPCFVGSVKTNIGHTEGAAGIAGLIKVALSLKQGTIPGNLHFENPNPYIPWQSLPLAIPTALTAWPDRPGPAVAGVSSFGISGTNAHVVLRNAPEISQRDRGGPRDVVTTHLLPLSARSPEALEAMARAYQTFLSVEGSGSPSALRNVCYTASVRRNHHEHRLAVVGRSAAELAEHLGAFLSREARPGMSVTSGEPGRRRKIVFVFPGQGSQWVGMGRRLLATQPAFREALERCDRAIREHVGWSVLSELTTDEAASRLAKIDVIQPTLFAVEVALAALWRSWGIEPHAVVGHSMGEVAAAHVAGALSLADATRIICRRSHLLKRVSGRGTMAVVELSIEEARRALAGYEDRLAVAVSNSPTSTVLSGDPAALDEVLAALGGRDIFCRPVKVDVASHSPQMDPLRADLLQALEGLAPTPPRVPIYSTVTSEIIGGGDLGPSYWVRNLREPVLFARMVERLAEEGHDVFIEMSPHPILLTSVQETLQHLGHEGSALSSARREADEQAVMLGSLGALYTLGHPVDWSRLYPGGDRVVPLPSYPWQRERLWYAPRSRSLGLAAHPLLGHRLHSPLNEVQFESLLDTGGYLGEHRVHGLALMPAAAYIEMALAAAADALGAAPRPAVTELLLEEGLVLPDQGQRTVQLILTTAGAGEGAFQVLSLADDEDGGWRRHATGRIGRARPEGGESRCAPGELAVLRARFQEEIPAEAHYRGLAERGFEFGLGFQGISRLWRHGGEALAEVRLPEALAAEAGAYRIHPVLLDACLQALVATSPADDIEVMHVAVGVERFELSGRPGPRLWSHASLRHGETWGDETVTGDVHLFEDEGRLVAVVEGIQLRRVTPDALPGRMRPRFRDWLYEVAWRPRALPGSETSAGFTEAVAAPEEPPADTRSREAVILARAPRGAWLVLADREGVGDQLARALQARGERCVLASPGETCELAGPDQWRVAPGDASHVQRLCQAMAASEGVSWRGVIHCWTLDTTAPESTTATLLETDQVRSCGSALHLVQALANGDGSKPRLWLVTRGAQAVGPGKQALAIGQAPVWGLGRVIALEHPELWGGLIDLDPAAPDATGLLKEIWSSDGEDQVAYRGGQRYVARVVRKTIAEEPSPGWRRDGAYLITGGLGRLGLRVAKWMAAQGAGHLVLVGRHGLRKDNEHESGVAGVASGTSAEVREIEALGATVEIVAADVADNEQMLALFERFGRGAPALRGVVHAAALTTTRLLSEMDLATLRDMLRAKVTGTWVLHELTRTAELDFFVLFSSTTAVLGAKGLAHYAAANQFLDALAHHARAIGRRALSVNWGIWESADLAGAEHIGVAERSGLLPMPTKAALGALEPLMWGDMAQVVVARADWAMLKQVYEARNRRPLLAEIDARATDATAHAIDRLWSAMPLISRGDLLSARPEERQGLLVASLQKQVAQVLGFGTTEFVNPQQPLNKLGLDSLMAIQLKNRIQTDLDVSIKVGSLLKGLSTAGLARELLERLAAAPDTSAPAASQVPDTPARLLARLDELADVEVDALLAHLLAEDEVPS